MAAISPLDRHYRKGILDPESLVGFATITEYVVLDVIGDGIKEPFCAPYDIVSESLGKINVKCSILHTGYTKYKKAYHWIFSKQPNAKIPDYYICLGMDEFQTEIIRVWIIPGNSDVVRAGGIFISPCREDRVKMYLVNPTIYNTTFQEMDILDKPEFRNTTKPKVSEDKYILKRWDALDKEYDRTHKLDSIFKDSTQVVIMENNTRLNAVRSAFQQLSEGDKKILLSQVIKVSGIENPETEIHILIKRGEIIDLSPNEFRLV